VDGKEIESVAGLAVGEPQESRAWIEGERVQRAAVLEVGEAAVSVQRQGMVEEEERETTAVGMGVSRASVD
jgi:hypothetical protein